MNFLDAIALISFIMQLQNNAILRKQATNDDIMNDLHNDVDRLEKKLDTLIDVVKSQNSS